MADETTVIEPRNAADLLLRVRMSSIEPRVELDADFLLGNSADGAGMCA